MFNKNKKVRFTQEAIALKDKRTSERIDALSFTKATNKRTGKAKDLENEILAMLSRVEKTNSKLQKL